jgi:hypothetical protein
MTSEVAMFAESLSQTLGCEEAKRSADPSANPLGFYPLRT